MSALRLARGQVDHLAGIGLQIAGLQFTRARHLETGIELVVGVHLEADLLQVEDDLADILEHAGNRAELVENPFDLDRGHRGTLQARKERSTERVPHRQAETSLQRLDRELAVAIGGGCLVQLDGFRHLEVLPLHRCHASSDHRPDSVINYAGRPVLDPYFE